MSTARDVALFLALASLVACSSTSDTPTAPAELSPNPQTWAVTDSSTILLPLGAGYQPTRTLRVGNVLRTYYVTPHATQSAPLTLVFSESVDGRNFSNTTITNLHSSVVPGTVSEPFFDHPDVIRRADGKYLMIYDYVTDTVASPTPRRLAAFVSADGITWGDSVMLPETTIDESPSTHKAIQARASMIQLADGSIRAYYNTGGASIGSARSTDGGVTWTEDAGYRLSADPGITVEDPSAIIDTDGSVLLYVKYLPSFSCGSGAGKLGGCSSIRMARAADGLSFAMYAGDVVHPPTNVVDNAIYASPDVFVGIDGTWRMQFQLFRNSISDNGGMLMAVRQP